MAIVVVEAGETSGAWITTQFAIDQGHEVFTAPRNITAQPSKGSNQLYPRGTHPLLSVRDLMNVLTQDPLHLDEIRSLPVCRLNKFQ